MKRSAFKTKMPERAPKRDREGEFANFTPQPRPAANGGSLTLAEVFAELAPRAQAPILLKTPGRKRRDIRDAARDEECTIRITGVCNHDRSTTVGCHFPGLAGDRGMGMKALDIAIAFGCSACHDVVDGRVPLPAGATRESVLLDYFMGHMRTLVRLARKGLL